MDGHIEKLEDEAVQLFFSRGHIANSLVAMCTTAKCQGDVITHVTTTMLRAPMQIQLTVLGMQPFMSKDLLFPYTHMNAQQREFILKALHVERAWTVFDSSMTLRRSGQPRHLSQLDILEGLCEKLLATKAYDDEHTRVVLCNIILQRVRASVPFSCALQNGLNARLFRSGDGGDASSCAVGSGLNARPFRSGDGGGVSLCAVGNKLFRSGEPDGGDVPGRPDERLNVDGEAGGVGDAAAGGQE